MKKKNVYVFLSFVIIIVVGIYFVSPLYHSRHRLEEATKQVAEFTDKDELKNGDIIFQTSRSAQSEAIQLATHSEYSHCGIIYKNDAGYYVLEAVQPVKETALDKWIAKGKSNHFVIKRLKNADAVLTTDVVKKMKQSGDSLKGKNYDIYFDWSDENMYCSELVWKIYQRATGLEIGKLEKLRDFDLTNEVVKQKLKERYGYNIPLDETVISPKSIFNSDLLITVKTD